MSCQIKRVIQLKAPINGTNVRLFCNTNNEITQTSMFSWSTDSVCWVNWVDYTTYKKLAENLDSDYYLRILIFGDFCSLQVNGEYTNCYSISLYTENPFISDFCDNKNLFNPYANLDCALMLQQQLSDSIVCMFGIDAYYFKVSPDRDSVDYTFKEYTLHNVESVKFIKLMLQDGQLPSSNPQMTEFDFEWDNDWEVEVSKTAFAKAFGDTAFPKQRDIVYVPMMKRLYEVNAAYDEKQEGLMWRATTWKLGMIKWNEKTNIDQGEFEDFIDNLTVNTYSEVFGKEYEEQERLSGVSQTESPTFAATNLYNIFLEDAVRKAITDSEKTSIIPYIVNNRSMRIGLNMYDFKYSDSVVLYQKKVCCESGMLSFLIHTDDMKTNIEKTIISIGDIEVIYNNTIKVKDIIFEPKKNTTYLISIRWNKQNHTVEMDVYEHTIIKEDMPLYMQKPEMFTFKEVNSFTTSYDERFEILNGVDVVVSPFPVGLSNIKIYDNAMSKEETFKESMKYTTNSPHCIINDVARPVEAPHGYSVR